MKNKLPTSIVLLWTMLSLNAIGQVEPQKGAWIAPKSALELFAPTSGDFYHGANEDNLNRWIAANGGKFFPQTHVPSTSTPSWMVTYHVVSTGVWFGPFEQLDEATDGLRRLAQLRQRILDAQVPDAEFITVRCLGLQPGSTIESVITKVWQPGVGAFTQTAIDVEAKKEADRIAQAMKNYDPKSLGSLSAEEWDRKTEAMIDDVLNSKTKDAISDLKGKHDPGGKDEGGNTEKGNGLDGPFPSSYAFSAWFARLAQVAIHTLDQVFCSGKCEAGLMKILTLAYMIMPDVMDRIVATLARIQDRLVDDDLEHALDRFTEVVDLINAIYQDLQRFYNLVNDPQFGELLKNVDLQTALDAIGKAGDTLGLDTHAIGKLKKACEFIPCDMLSYNNLADWKTTAPKFKERVTDAVVDKTVDYAEGKLEGVPLLGDLDLRAIKELGKNIKDPKQWDKFGRAQAKALGCKRLGSYRAECDLIADGKAKEAVKSATARALGDATGLKKEDIEGVMSGLINKDKKEVLRAAKNMLPGKFYELAGITPAEVEAMINNPKDVGTHIDAVCKSFISRAIQDPKIATVFRAQYQWAIAGGRGGDWKTAFVQAFKEFGVDEQTTLEVLNTSFDTDLQEMLGEMGNELQITSPDAIDLLKQGRYREAIESQMEYSSATRRQALLTTCLAPCKGTQEKNKRFHVKVYDALQDAGRETELFMKYLPVYR